jgi:hypothetical protein
MYRFKLLAAKAFKEAFRNRLSRLRDFEKYMNKMLMTYIPEIKSKSELFSLAEHYANEKLLNLLKSSSPLNCENSNKCRYNFSSPENYDFFAHTSLDVDTAYLAANSDYAVPKLPNTIAITRRGKSFTIQSTNSFGSYTACDEAIFSGNVNIAKIGVNAYTDKYSSFRENKHYPAVYQKLVKLLLYPNHYIENVYIDKCFVVLKFSSNVTKKIDINELINAIWYFNTSATIREERRLNKRNTIDVYDASSNPGCEKTGIYHFEEESYLKKNVFSRNKYKSVNINSYFSSSHVVSVYISRYMYTNLSLKATNREIISSRSVLFSENKSDESRNTKKNDSYSYDVYKYVYLYENINFKIDLNNFSIIDNSIQKSLFTTFIDKIYTSFNDNVNNIKDVWQSDISPKKIPLEVFLI